MITDVLADATGGLVLAGAAGAGKTRLARAALSVAAELGRPVRWASAARATREIPLGAMSHLIGPPAPGADELTLLQCAVAALAGPYAGGPLVLAVDDAHLLDELSIALVHQLTVAGSVTVLLTVRTGEMPAPLTALFKDGLVTRVDVAELSRDLVERMAGTALDGDLDARTAERLWQLSQGNPQFLRELVDGGLRSGRLRRRDDLWWWEGTIEPTPWLVDLVADRLDVAEPAQRAALEALATAEPLRLATLDGLVPRDSVVALERHGAVVVERGVARLAHPLYGPVLRSRMPESEAYRIRARIVRIAEQGRQLSPDDLLRITELRLASGADGGGAADLATAAELANVRLDHAGAERLARAAIQRGAGVNAQLTLIESVQWQGRAGEADRLAVAVAPQAVTEVARIRLGTLRAVNLYCGLNRPEASERVLVETAGRVGHGAGRSALVATRALLALLAGQPGRAIELGEEAARHAGPESRPLAAAAMAGGMAVQGRIEDALAAVRLGWAALEEGHPGASAGFARTVLAQAEVLALMLGGRVNELLRRAHELHARSLSGPQGVGDAVSALHLGWAYLSAGRVRAARRWLGEARAGLLHADPSGLLPLCASQLALTEALLGRADVARALLADGDPARRPVFPLHAPTQMLAEAWVRAAEGDSTAAGSAALAAADVAAEGGQPAAELLLLHTAVRLGRSAEVAERMRELAAGLEQPLPAVLAAHARAVVDGDGTGLDQAADRFEEIGAWLRAADAAAQAADAHERAGDRRAASVSRVRAAKLAGSCDGSRTPALDDLTPPRLTSREDEVARLAARGMHNQAIASRLVLSVRTVEAHLAKTYTKLGIVGRHELSDTLAPAPSLPRSAVMGPGNMPVT